MNQDRFQEEKLNSSPHSLMRTHLLKEYGLSLSEMEKKLSKLLEMTILTSIIRYALVGFISIDHFE